MRVTKNNTYIVLLVALLFSMGACKDYLDLEPEYTQDAQNYFSTPEHYELALIGAYDLMQPYFYTLWIGEMASDNSIAGGESPFDTKGLHDIDNMIHNAVNNELRTVFRMNYAGIGRVNFMFENRNNIEFSKKDEIFAQAYFLRGFYYFQLVKYFGGVPLVIDNRIVKQDEVNDSRRATAAEVYTQIESDLNNAISALPWTASERGRITKGAALSLLGKVYLYQNKYQLAANTFDQVINQGGYALETNYADIFKVINEGNSEIILAIQATNEQGADYGCLHCSEGNPAAGFHGIRGFKSPQGVDPEFSSGNSYNLPTKDLYDAFGANDVRRDASILDIDAWIQSQPRSSEFSYIVGGGGHTGYYNNKYSKRQANVNAADDDLTSPIDQVVIRYADVLLMAAEANARLGNDGLALTYLNQVRSRVSLPGISSGGQTLLEDIWKERRLELACEGHRFFDLVRTGQAVNEISGFVVGKHELFPIPQAEIDLAGNNWNQNPGY